jgi:hypothetical protein
LGLVVDIWKFVTLRLLLKQWVNMSALLFKK